VGAGDWGWVGSGLRWVGLGARSVQLCELVGRQHVSLLWQPTPHPPRPPPNPSPPTTVFSRYDFASWRVLEHSHHPIDWESSPTHPLASREPRRGRRATLVADVAAPGGHGGGALRVYCTHLEVFCGILGRVWQFSDIMRDVRQSCCAGGGRDGGGGGCGVAEAAAAAGQAGAVSRFAVLGDLNTVG